MDLSKYIGNPRITDYSFQLADAIQKMTFPTSHLINLYSYNLNLSTPPNALYPMSNWQSHRLCLMASIARKLNDKTRAWACHTMCLKWIPESSCKCCPAASQDYHYRDSCEYKVYGWWALCQAMVHLQPLTRFAYKPLFANYFKWLQPYKNGSVKHVEYIRSQIASDVNKPSYGKLFDPNYNTNLVRVYQQLTA